MDEILANPEIGARKDGKLVDIYVHKILIVNQEFLIAYTFNREKRCSLGKRWHHMKTSIAI